MKFISNYFAPVALLTLAFLAGCSSSGPKQSASTHPLIKRGGGYYQDDGPGSNIPANLLAIPDAVPRIEPHAPANSRPYRVFGVTYVPKTGNQAFRQKGIASWYGKKFHGNKTANGERYDMYAMTAAHPTLPIPSYAKVTRTNTNKSVIVRINDRGPFHGSRIIDLSYAAAAKLDLIGPGKGEVVVEAITHADIAQGKYKQPQQMAAAAVTTRPVVHQAASPVSAPPSKPVIQSTAATSQPADIPDAMLALSQLPAPGGTATAPAATRALNNRQSGVFLQFGAFSGAENAHSLAQRLNTQIAGIEHRNAHIDTRDDLYRVQIGPYSNRTEAVNAAHRIRESTGTAATVVAIR